MNCVVAHFYSTCVLIIIAHNKIMTYCMIKIASWYYHYYSFITYFTILKYGFVGEKKLTGVFYCSHRIRCSRRHGRWRRRRSTGRRSFVFGYATAPNHPTATQIHGFSTLEHTRYTQSAVEFVTVVPTRLRNHCVNNVKKK